MKSFVLASALAALLISLGSCQAREPSMERLYDKTLRDYARHDGAGGFDPKIVEALEERYALVRDLVEAGKIVTAEDCFFAGAILSTADRPEELMLSAELAAKAAEMGETRALLIVAEATDKVLLKQGMMQRYGTQIVYERVFSRWRLHPVDPRTTDEERHAMGLPPLAELEALVEAQNESELTERLRPQ